MQWCVLIVCGKEVFCRQGDFQSMLRVLGLKYYTHPPTFGSDLNIYGDCQWCAGNRSGTNEIQSTFLLTHRFAFSRTILLALTLNEMSHALLTLCSYQKYPALWPYLSATPDHSCGYTHLHCCYPIWNSFPEVGCSSQPRKYVFDFFLHTILGLLLLVVVISSK